MTWLIFFFRLYRDLTKFWYRRAVTPEKFRHLCFWQPYSTAINGRFNFYCSVIRSTDDNIRLLVTHISLNRCGHHSSFCISLRGKIISIKSSNTAPLMIISCCSAAFNNWLALLICVNPSAGALMFRLSASRDTPPYRSFWAPNLLNSDVTIRYRSFRLWPLWSVPIAL